MRAKWLIIFFLISIICVLGIVASLFFFDRSKPSFSYRFYDSEVKFPLLVGEAIKKYNVLPHRYDKSGKETFSTCLQNAKTNAVSDIFYVRNADDYEQAPADSLDRNVYAVKFCFAQPSEFKEVLSKLETDFNRQFERKTSLGINNEYLQLKVNDYVSVVIDFYPGFTYNYYKVTGNNPKMWSISFCYGLHDSTISHYMTYERAYDAQ